MRFFLGLIILFLISSASLTSVLEHSRRTKAYYLPDFHSSDLEITSLNASDIKLLDIIKPLGGIFEVKFSDSGRYLGISNENGVSVWEANTGYFIHHFRHIYPSRQYVFISYLRGFSFSPDDETIISISTTYNADWYNNIQVWNIPSQKKLRTHGLVSFLAVNFMSNSAVLYSDYVNSFLYHTSTTSTEKLNIPDYSTIRGLSANGKYVLFSAEPTLYHYDLEQKRFFALTEDFDHSIPPILIDAFVVTVRHGNLWVYGEMDSYPVLTGSSWESLTKLDSHCFAASNPNQTAIWCLEEGVVVQKHIIPHASDLISCFCQNNLGILMNKGVLEIWDLNTGHQLWSTSPIDLEPVGIVASPQKNMFVLYSFWTGIYIYGLPEEDIN